jgi:hypothetical protein
MQRREFIKTSIASGLACATGLAQTDRGSMAPPFVGIQIAPHSFYDEGIGYCLDLLKETGRINTLMISSLAYYGAMGRPPEVMADHGVPLVDNSQRTLPRVWVRHHERYYGDTSLRHMKPDPGWTYFGKEIYADLATEAHKRGIKLYERMYEPTDRATAFITNFESVLETDIFGKPGSRPCLNNPDYRAWLTGSVRDLFESYDLDGIQYGAERSGPLSDWLAWGKTPGCFCSHCTARARKRGIDPERTRQGLITIYKYVSTLKEGGAPPVDGIMTVFLRILLRYPEVLAWELQWSRSLNDLHHLLYDTIKTIKPQVQVGRHVDHQQSTYALLFRAAADYSEMTESNDFIKLILYHDIAGPRVLGKLDNLQKHVLQELSRGQTLDLYYRLFGYDPETEAGIEALAARGLSPTYVQREIHRAVAGVRGGAAVYAGIGLDIPKGSGWGTDKWQSDPEEVYRATKLTFEAGGRGVVASREYEEITLDSLRAVGRAVRDVAS